MHGITSDDIWTKLTRMYNHRTSCEKRSMRCGIICHSRMSDAWFTVCGDEWQQLKPQMMAPHISDCYSVITVQFLFAYLPLCDLIVIYRFSSLYMFTQINKLITEDSYCSYRFSVHFLLDCLRYSASCTKIGNFWTLGLVIWITTITHQACPFLSNFAENSQNTYFITLPMLMVELNV